METTPPWLTRSSWSETNGSDRQTNPTSDATEEKPDMKEKTENRKTPATATRAKSSAHKPRDIKATKPTEPVDAWKATRALVAERINLLTTADCMRLFTRGVHPGALVLEINACPDLAEFERTYGGTVQFVMGARLTEDSSSTTNQMCANVVGVERDGHVAFHAIHQVKWQRGENRELPELKPLAELKPRFQQNRYAMSVSLEGLAVTQLDRTDITMKDILDGFLIAHRGLRMTELTKRYTYTTAQRISYLLNVAAPYVSEEDGRMKDWHGWPDTAERTGPAHHALEKTAKEMHKAHAKGHYGIGRGLRLIPKSDYEDIEVRRSPETRETVALLQEALKATNLPSEAETRILAAIETLTVKRGKVYNSEDA